MTSMRKAERRRLRWWRYCDKIASRAPYGPRKRPPGYWRAVEAVALAEFRRLDVVLRVHTEHAFARRGLL